jgi:hypothetical protein
MNGLPRSSIATKLSIFLLRPASVFTLCVRNASANRFCADSFSSIAAAFGLA